MIDFTVAICTYNGEKRVPDVLDRLKQQIDTEDINWEIIVIDNNSNDNTAKVIKEYQNNWNFSNPIKYYLETRQGLAYARRCAIKNCQSELIGFLDDDNLPSQNWVKEAYIFGKQHPNAGAYGGQIHGLFEVEPPPGFERIARYFALIKGDKTYCYNEKYKDTRKKMYPPGAGIVIRKKAWLESVPEEPLLPQTNEDLEMLSQIFNQGWEIWFNHLMEIEHFIPQSRFEPEYLKKFFRQNGLCRYQVRMFNYSNWQKPFITILYFINDLKKIIVFYIKNKKNLKKDVVCMGEMELLRHILMSPFSY
ncbi:glycosyltransferase family 2 protein [Cyanobacterium stanieri LEGE 03274]|uniref:Glycosyltransferase family 2 protein n=1 Tax=Cyanobacterium stanieri LEGE 03274 TaxID=1828756 RepID=A0ABR9V0S7_9CHRO|nr:hormogonium polysaccharide biosynthesis glycosyltransferase HpsE [Cyanobacterium stanieri]MBE9221488.1 glycosyltransferase family 2 protein [Cyanobacterium stanieri LEGE 03274]